MINNFLTRKWCGLCCLKRHQPWHQRCYAHIAMRSIKPVAHSIGDVTSWQTTTTVMKLIIDSRLSLLPAPNQMSKVRALRGAAERGMTQRALAQRRRRGVHRPLSSTRCVHHTHTCTSSSVTEQGRVSGWPAGNRVKEVCRLSRCWTSNPL